MSADWWEKTHPQRALMCETARAVDDCLKDKVLAEAQKEHEKEYTEIEQKFCTCLNEKNNLFDDKRELEGKLRESVAKAKKDLIPQKQYYDFEVDKILDTIEKAVLEEGDKQ